MVVSLLIGYIIKWIILQANKRSDTTSLRPIYSRKYHLKNSRRFPFISIFITRQSISSTIRTRHFPQYLRRQRCNGPLLKRIKFLIKSQAIVSERAIQVALSTQVDAPAYVGKEVGIIQYLKTIEQDWSLSKISNRYET